MLEYGKHKLFFLIKIIFIVISVQASVKGLKTLKPKQLSRSAKIS